MKKLILIGVVLALVTSACGGAGEPAGVTTTADAMDPIEPTPADTVSSDEAPVDSEPDESGIAPDDPALEVAPVNPPNEADKPVPAPPATGGGATNPPIVDHGNPQVAASIADLAGRLGVDTSSIEVVSVEEVTWRDGSIGCPQPGMSYTQALVNGSRIVLRVSGQDHQYNSGGGRDPFYCANPSDPVPGQDDYGDT
jgi:hypothetical protein